MKKLLSVIIAITMLAGIFTACGAPAVKTQDDGKLSVVATIFPAYDFAKAVLGDKANVTLLIPPGSEIHSYEPTPQDIITIQNCDIFLYNGGDSDEWVDGVLESMSKTVTIVPWMNSQDYAAFISMLGRKDAANAAEPVSKEDMPDTITTIRMMDCVETVTEEVKEGMEAEHEEPSDEPEYDEHVWTSPVNAGKIAEVISQVASAIDTNSADAYNENLADYKAKLFELDTTFRNVVSAAKRKVLVFADRFPARYFTEEYGLEYFAAYPGCAEETEASAKTVAFLADKVRAEDIPYVLYIEFSNEKMADTIAEDTGCGKLEFNSCHNVSKTDLESGVTYLDLMWRNVDTLKGALN